MDFANPKEFIHTSCRCCRIFKVNDDNSKLISIEVMANNHIASIKEVLQSTVHRLPNIYETDQLPQKICVNCLETLMQCSKFEEMCLRSDEYFRNLTGTKIDETFVKTDPLEDDDKLSSTCDLANTNNIVDNDYESDDDVPLKYCFVKMEEELQQQTKESEPCGDWDHAINNDGSSSLNGINSDGDADGSLKTHKRSSKSSTKRSKIKADCSLGQVQECVSIFLCKQCNRTFKNKAALLSHEKTHSRINNKAVRVRIKKENKCEDCNEGFKTLLQLVQHRQEIHAETKVEVNPEKPYICDVCNKAFKQSWTLKDHLRTHTKEQPYLCSECGRAFNSHSNMQQHLLRHTGEKRYECPDCPRKFPCLSDLASHKQIHKKLRPHVCDLCGSAFGKPYQLKKHKMYHDGIKPHKCEHCEKSFVTGDHMRRHMRTHTGEKPYKCKYCDRAFVQSNDLIKHLRMHLGDNVYKCELCPQGFRLASALREHFSQHKNDDDETRHRNRLALQQEEENLRIKLKTADGFGRIITSGPGSRMQQQPLLLI